GRCHTTPPLLHLKLTEVACLVCDGGHRQQGQDIPAIRPRGRSVRRASVGQLDCPRVYNRCRRSMPDRECQSQTARCQVTGTGCTEPYRVPPSAREVMDHPTEFSVPPRGIPRP